MRHLFLSNRFFTLFGILTAFFVFAFPFHFLFPVAQGLFFAAIAVVVTDYFLLFRKVIRFECVRKMAKKLSLGDPNPVYLTVKNLSPAPFRLRIIDELPYQFQKRDFEMTLRIQPGQEQMLHYELTPIERGVYQFGQVHFYLETTLGLLQRRITFSLSTEVPVYPSILQMKKYELRAFDRVSLREGIKKIRKLGHTYEFEQIKDYVRGDDYRSVNWKATGRGQGLMVNQYSDERSQEVYCLIDKSRVMKMPFEGLSLLDYSINATLAISNIILRKYDKAGLLSFSDKLGTFIKADRKTNHLHHISEALYKEREHNLEADYELFYHAIRRLIPHRSLLLLFTNFESQYALDRVLPLLRRINRFHLLVVIFFENTEVKDFSNAEVKTLEGIYVQAVAQKFVAEKMQMIQKLQQFGIQSVLTRPEDLSINTINKYLELKSRGMI